MVNQLMLFDEPSGPVGDAKPVDGPESIQRPSLSPVVIVAPTPLNTIGRIALLLSVPIHRVRWVLDTRDDIQPVALAGRTRLFDAMGVARIRHEINAIDARRCDPSCGEES